MNFLMLSMFVAEKVKIFLLSYFSIEYLGTKIVNIFYDVKIKSSSMVSLYVGTKLFLKVCFVIL